MGPEIILFAVGAAALGYLFFKMGKPEDYSALTQTYARTMTTNNPEATCSPVRVICEYAKSAPDISNIVLAVIGVFSLMFSVFMWWHKNRLHGDKPRNKPGTRKGGGKGGSQVKKALAFLCIAILSGCGGATTDLTKASDSGNLLNVQQFIADGVDINEPDADGRTPLIWASWKGHPEVVKALLNAGADPNVKSAGEGGWTSLLLAVRWNHPEIVEMLLDAGANPNITRVGEDALLIAKLFKYNEMIAMIEDAKIEWARRADAEKQEELRLALEKEEEDREAAEVAAKEEKAAESVAANPVFSAIAADDVAALQSVLNTGGNPNTADAEGRRPLHYAAENGNAAIVSLLLVNRANPNAGDKDGITPFMTALESDNAAAVEMMIFARADMDSVSRKGLTPWHFVPYHTATGDALKVLLEYSDDGWREQQFFYEEDKLQRQWEQEEKNEAAQKIETEKRLAEARKKEAERRARQAEINAAESQRQHEAALAAQNRNSAFVNTLIGAGVDIYSAKTQADAQVDAARAVQQGLAAKAKADAEQARIAAEAETRRAELQARHAREDSQNEQTAADAQISAANAAAENAQRQAEAEANLAKQQEAEEERRAVSAHCVHVQQLEEGHTLNWVGLENFSGPGTALINKCGYFVNIRYCLSNGCALNRHASMRTSEAIVISSGRQTAVSLGACKNPYRVIDTGSAGYSCER